ncbi:MAG TPA: glycosyltransferase [Sphingobacterium sp.]|nr:glycosyltransferase [Sphingobacterium sp.]
MKENPKISVIVPVYNVEKYIDRCIKTLLNQTLIDIEIILVDDGSPDNSPVICDQYAEGDQRVKVVHKANGGLGYARNSGIEVATGEYIAFVDSDDYVDTNMYKTLYEVAKDNNSDLVFCGFNRELKKGKFFPVSECKELVQHEGNEEIGKLLLDFIASKPNVSVERKYAMSVWHGIYKLEIIKENNIRFVSEREYASEDLPFQIDFFKKANKINFIPDIFYYYCFNDSSLTKTFVQDKYFRFKRHYFLIREKTSDLDPYFFRANRYIIGAIRIHILRLINSNLKRSEKIKFIEDICNDPLWAEINTHFKSSFLSIYQAIFLRLMVKNMPYLLFYFSTGVSFFKNIMLTIKGK